MLAHQRRLPAFSIGTKPKPKDTKKVKTISKKNIQHKGKTGTLEKEFLEEFEGKLAIAIGCKGSGKSFLLLHYVYYALEHDMYDEYHLVLPCYLFEERDSYSWLKNHKTPAKIYIYNEHDEMIMNKLIDRPQPYNKAFYGIDDSTGSWSIQADPDEIKYLSRLRHFRVTQFIVVHVVRAGLPASLRAQIDMLFLFMSTNRIALQAAYEEWGSMTYPNFKEFLQVFKENVLDKKYNAMLIFCRKVNTIDTNVHDWLIQGEDLEKK